MTVLSTLKRLCSLSIFFLVTTQTIFSQVTAELDILQIKYWNYRNRLKRDFTLVGDLAGNSLTPSRRQYAEQTYPWIPCYQALNLGNGTGYHSKGLVQWGDALAHHGTYLAMLASEYKLLKQNNQSTSGTLIELY